MRHHAQVAEQIALQLDGLGQRTSLVLQGVQLHAL